MSDTLTDIYDRIRRVRRPRPARLLAAAAVVLACSACTQPQPPADPARQWKDTNTEGLTYACTEFGDRVYGMYGPAIAVVPGGCR